MKPTQEIEKAFYSDGFRLGMDAMKSGSPQSALFESIALMYSVIDEMNDTFLNFAAEQAQPAHCKKGCKWCCYQPIFALNYELDFLNSHLKSSFDDQSLAEIRQRAKLKNDKLNKLQGDNLLNSKAVCPLLIDGACMAYTARPMACRIYLSSDVETCHTFYKTPEDKVNYPALLEFPMRAGRMMNEGFKSALRTNGVLVKEYRIEEKILSG